MLVAIPIGLWVFSFISDLICLRSAVPETWQVVAYWTLIGGIVGALLAAVPGLIDLMSLRGTPVLTTALTHMGINLTVVALYAVNAWLRHQAGGAPGGLPLTLSVVAIAMLLVSGWLGGKMVYLSKVGVTEEPEARPRDDALRGTPPEMRHR
jgi:uncharacterized membrane protein